jgi:preprotein translocase subunit SecA
MGEDNQIVYKKADDLARRLTKGLDFTVEEKTKNAVLTEQGIKKSEKLLGIEYLFDLHHMETAHQLVQSLRAHHLFEKNVDYVIKEDEIIIVDEFTGRLMIGRRYSDGLHQAIEAKERVTIKQESQTLATVTFQNYFRMYQKLAGMTGTAKTEEGEFWKIYGLEVVVIPTNKPLNRENLPDVIYKTKRAKFQAVVKEIEESYKKERPVLVGTVSIEHSELLSTMLARKGIPHHVLNAKQHAREAEIVAKAGQRKAVTISTNMAGRGTDIILGEGVSDLGGLYVIGTERHESRRIDNQLRGRSGRQGDPGSSKFYVSLEDDLMRIFGSNRVSGIMDRLGIEEDTPIEHSLITRAIENAQKKVEEYYFSIRKQVLEYDNVMNKQRETIYTLRRKILKSDALREKVYEMMEQVADSLCQGFLPDQGECDTEGLIAALKEIVPIAEFDRIKEMLKKDEIKAFILQVFRSAYEQKKAHIGEEALKELERVVMLRVLDGKWIEQLHSMDSLREGIGLRAYGQRDPLLEYKIEAYGLFQEMMHSARIEILGLLYKVVLVKEGETVPKETMLPKPRITHFSGAGENPSVTVHKETNKVGRNDPCPCGSGKKYKKCCLNKKM